MFPTRSSLCLTALVAVGCLAWLPGHAQGQSTSIRPASIPEVASRTSTTSATANANLGTTPTTQPMAVSLYANPYMNPWVNPMLMNGQYSRNDLAWYAFAGQQATMGLGTGRLSGIRDEPRSRPKGVSGPLPTRIPGSTASGYFQRGFTAGRPSAGYFQRPSGTPGPVSH